MKDRIKRYMDYKNISAGELATLLEVQRSNISHILNGRNMPGAAFIEKLLNSFQDINARWLLTGVGEMISDTDNVKRTAEPDTSAEEKVTEKPKESIVPPVKLPFAGNVTKTEKAIEKVVLLYSDGTFTDYNK